MIESPHYALSQDYECMRELLDDGPLLGFIDFDGGTLRDPVRIRKLLGSSNNSAVFSVGVRGYGYLEVWEHMGGWYEFVNQCRKHHLSYIVPNAEVSNAD